MIKHAVKTHPSNGKRSIKVAFFDCTNTWFETPYDDASCQIIRYTRKKVRELTKAGLCAEDIQAYLDDEAFAEELAYETEVQKADVLRVRGCSKEGRYAQPLVTVALVIDQCGFPVGCKVFEGNLSEIHTVESMINSLKEKYEVKDIYLVADRGLNSAEKLEMIRDKELGFVVAQKVARLDQTSARQMFDLEGYRNCSFRADGSLSVCETEKPNPEAFRFKVCDYVKRYRTKFSRDSEGETVGSTVKTVAYKIIYTFSSERRARDLADLDAQISKATKAVADGLLLGNLFGSGWRSLLMTKKEQTSDKKEKEMFRACGLKTEVVGERRKVAGYAAVVFSHPNEEKAIQLSDEEGLQSYHRLMSIEDCFRVIKNSFSIRPIHVRLREHIIAHCCLCVLSLMLMKSLQEKLREKGWEMSSSGISQALAQAYVLPLPAAEGKVSMFMNLGLHAGFHHPDFTGKSRRIAEENETEDGEEIWKAFKKRREVEPASIDRILEAVNLKPLNLYNSVREIKKKLGILSVPATDLISGEL